MSAFFQMMMAHLYCGGAECLEVSVSDLLEVWKFTYNQVIHTVVAYIHLCICTDLIGKLPSFSSAKKYYHFFTAPACGTLIPASCFEKTLWNPLLGENTPQQCLENLPNCQGTYAYIDFRCKSTVPSSVLWSSVFVLWSRFVRLWNWQSSVKASSCKIWLNFWTVISLKSWCWALTAALHSMLMLWMGCRPLWLQGCTRFVAHVELERVEKIIRKYRYVQKTRKFKCGCG